MNKETGELVDACAKAIKSIDGGDGYMTAAIFGCAVALIGFFIYDEYKKNKKGLETN